MKQIPLSMVRTMSLILSIVLMTLFAQLPASAGQFPIPDTGQTTCYGDEGNVIDPCPKPGEPFYGQDANYAINPRSYTKLDERGNDLPITATSWTMVRDNVTGLIWEVKTDDGSIHDKDDTYSWEEAESIFIAGVNAKNFGGHSDWRLPDINELASITNKGQYLPAIDEAYFPNIISNSYWSSTTYASDSDGAWRVNFSNGDVDFYYKSHSYYVRAVRGGQTLDTGSFDYLVINGNETVTDPKTNLMWQQNSVSEFMTWQEALSHCEALSLGGYDDWRLPTATELQSIVDYGQYSPAIDVTFFPDSVSSGYWSSTTYAYNSGYAWLVNFNDGYVDDRNKSRSYYVRAVRGGQSSDIGPFDPLVISVEATPHQGTIPFETTLTCTISSGNPPYTTQWAFGDGATGNGESITHTYAAGGSYTAVATVTDAQGNRVSHSVEVFGISLDAIDISPTRVTLTQPGDAMRFLVRGYRNNGDIVIPESIIWTSSDPNVVTVEDGNAVAVGEGIAVITATVGELIAEAQVQVNFDPVGIDVSPVLLFLAVGESASPVVTLLYPDGGQRELSEVSEFTLSLVSGSEFVRIDGQNVVGLSNGVSTVAVSAGTLSETFRVSVSAPIPLNIVPGAVRVKPLEAVTVAIDGGTAPYTPADGMGTITQSRGKTLWQLLAPSEGGDSIYKISDGSGQAAELNLTVLVPLTIHYQSAGSPRRRSGTTHPSGQRDIDESFALNALGGVPPFTWHSPSGEIVPDPSDDGDHALIYYTPPDTPGIYTVTVVDSGGQRQEFKVSTYQAYNVLPERLYLSPEESGDVSIYGGVSPYGIDAENGSVGAVKEFPGVYIFSYTAPSMVGEYMVTISDARGSQTRIYITVKEALAASPSQQMMTGRETKSFEIVGAVGNDDEIFVTALKGAVDLHPNEMRFTYEAPEKAGRDVVTITDASGAQCEVVIDIVGSDHDSETLFFIQPVTATLLKNEKKRYKAVGGTGQDIAWRCDVGGISGQHQPSIEYTAPDNNAVNTTLSAMDSAEHEATAEIHVVSDHVLISPSQVYLKPGEQVEFQGHFGTGRYTFTWTAGEGAPAESVERNDRDASNQTGTSGSLIYTAPAKTGTHIITVFDSAGNSDSAEVIVSGGAKRREIETAALFDIIDPSDYPNAETQPVGVGNVQSGQETFAMAFDFPNYEDAEGNRIPTNFYVAGIIPDLNSLILFDGVGGIHLPGSIQPCMSSVTDAVYFEGLRFDYCHLGAPLAMDIYIVAVASKFDPNGNLSFEPADAPFELWHFDCSFPQCR